MIVRNQTEAGHEAEHDAEVRNRIECRFSYRVYPLADVAAILTATEPQLPQKSWSGVGVARNAERLGIKPRRVIMRDHPEEWRELVRRWRD